MPYRIELTGGGLDRPMRLSGVVHAYAWDVTWFPWTADPREDLEAWRAQSEGPDAVTQQVVGLELPYGGGGPAQLAEPHPLARRDLPADRFGTIARASVAFPAGRWRFVTSSDDGVRVTADGEVLIDDWTWHAPTRDEGVLELEEARTVELVVEHFELDGHAVLSLSIEPAD
jgi:hypothetical protein